MEENHSMTLQVSEKETDKEIHPEAINEYSAELKSAKPVKRTRLASLLYLHKDSWYANATVLEGLVALRRHFAARQSDVLLASFPKTGTTWMKALIYSTVHCRGTQRERDNAARKLTELSPHELVPFLELCVYNPAWTLHEPTEFSSATPPRLYATHIPAQTLPCSMAASGCRVVYVFRDPKDVFVSLAHFLNSTRPNGAETNAQGATELQHDLASLEEEAEQFCRGVNLYGSYWDHVLGYQSYSRTSPANVLLCKYEDIIADPATNVRRLATFLGIPFMEEEEENGVVEEIVRLCSFQELRRVNQQTGDLISLPGMRITKGCFFRRGEAGDWVNLLSPEIARRIDLVTEEKFGTSGPHSSVNK